MHSAGITVGRWLLVFGLAAGLASSGAYAAESDEVVRQAAQACAAGQATPAQQSIVFKNQARVQYMATHGQFGGTPQANNAVFQSCQKVIDAKVGEAYRMTAEQTGLEIKQPARESDPLPGTDNDGQIRTKDGKPLTHEQWQRANEAFQRNVQRVIEKGGVNPEGPVDSGADLLPDPNNTSREDFTKITRDINNQGGTAYDTPEAARAQEALSSQGKQPMSFEEGKAFVDNMQRLANDKFSTADMLDAHARQIRGTDPGKAAQLEAQAQIYRSQGAKYIQRIDKAAATLAAQNHVDVTKPEGPAADAAATAAKNRGQGTQAEAAQTGALGEHLVNQSTMNYIETMARIAKADPSKAAACEANIAQAMQNLSPAQQGQAVEAVRGIAGDAPAANVAKQAQNIRGQTVIGEGGLTVDGQAKLNKLNNAMKYLGPAMIAYDGARRINNVINAKDPGQQAGKELAGFTGGTVAGAAGGVLGWKAGALLGTQLGAIGGIPGAIIGGIGGALVGGIGGYMIGDHLATPLGDTNSAWWEKNKPDTYFDEQARKKFLDVNKDVFGQLLEAGLSPEAAAAAANAYAHGSLAEFNRILHGARDKLLKDWKDRKFRRFSDLGTNEVQQLLDCLCSASLGANPWVAQGYNTTIPHDADPQKHSCGSLGNGPCMAQGFGCWRSFIDWSRPGISDCIASFNVNTNDRNVIFEIDKFANAPFEKPLKVTAKAEPAVVCRGQYVTVTASAEGGRPPYYFRVAGQHESYTGPETYPPEDRIRRFGPRELENLNRAVEQHIGEIRTWETRGDYNIGNVWTNGRSFQVHAPHVTGSGYYMDIVVAVYAPGPQTQGLRGENACMEFTTVRVLVLSDAECDWKDNKATPKPKPPKKAGDGATGAGPHIGLPPADEGSGPAGASPSQPQSPASPKGGSGSGTSTAAGPDTSGPDKEPAGGGDKSGGEPAPPTAPKNVKDPGWKTDKGWDKGPAAPPAPPSEDGAPPQPGECQLGGGAYGTSEGPMVMFGEVPGNQRVRITITGSDGFSQSAEGVGRAELSRPVSPNGTDTITIENLDVPGCKEAQQRSYDASGQPIMESPFDTNAPSATDLAGAEGEILATPAGAFDEPAVGAFADARSAKSAAQTAAGLRNMDAQGTLVSASSAGDQILADATRVRDQAGAAASASAARSAGQVAAADAKNAWGNVLGDSLASGLEQGLSSAASAFGSEAGSRVAGEIFDDDHGHHDPASGDGDGAEEGATQVASAPQAGTAKSPPKNRGDSKHGDRDRGDRDAGDGGDAGSKAVSATCPACGVTSTFPDGKVSPWCPNCCAGPYSTQCATCGFLWCGKKGPPPACCPNCGTCGSGPAPEALTPPGGSEPGGVVVPGEILVTPADAGSGGGAPLVDPSPLEP